MHKVPAILELEGVNQWFMQKGFLAKPKQVLFDVSFNIMPGQVVGFVGVNGAGKTTSIKTILGFLKLKQGHIRYFGEPSLTNEVKQKIGFMPERPWFYDYLTGEEFLWLHWQLSLKDSRLFAARCEEVLTEVNLLKAKNLRLRQYSKGMLQRIGLAQAFLCNPEFVILDEPMSGLDPDGRLLVKGIMKSLKDSGVSLLFSSHLLSDMEELCTHLLIIDQGKILFFGPKHELLAMEKAGQAEINYFNQSDELKTIRVDSKYLQQELQRLLAEGSIIHEVKRSSLSLEEAFRHLRNGPEKDNPIQQHVIGGAS